jgi:D-ornithine 4,5-aminomutase subunit alpha
MRADEYLAWRTHLAEYSDEQLETIFWDLVEQIVDPLVELASTHTSPSIERSVLMRMGIDSPTCNAVVSEVEKRNLLGHGAGHIVWHCATQWDVDVRAAAAKLARGEGWETVDAKWAPAAPAPAAARSAGAKGGAGRGT